MTAPARETTTVRSAVLALVLVAASCQAPTGGPSEPGLETPASAGAFATDAAMQQEMGAAAADEGVSPRVAGYPPEKRQVGTPTDVVQDLATSFPKPDSVFRGRVPEGYFGWKEELYEKAGVKLGISYQGLFQKASDTTNGFPLPAEDTDLAAGGWLLIEGKWEAYNQGEDWQGGLTAALDWRHGFGNAADPAAFQAETGSLWATDFAYLPWDPWFPVLYWEQWGKKDVFVVRLGNQVALQMYDFFRFKDPRTSFTGSPFTAPSASIPFPPPGLGASFEWWPTEGSPLYVVGTVNDMNTEVGRFSWDNALEYGQFFYGFEVGYNWARSRTDFDHVHLALFHADERDTAAPVFPNAAGGGFKLAGSKQWDQTVGFANYTYNSSEGGGFGLTLAEHAANAGVARLEPLGYRGELAVGASWAHPIQNFQSGLPTWDGARDQYGLETYWKLLLMPDLWVTPGVQMIFDPSYNPDTDFIGIARLKFRLFL